MNQREILLAFLHTHGPTTCAELEKLCDVRSVTTRMAELIRRGCPIVKSTGLQQNSRGQPRRVTYYALKPHPIQGDLFAPDKAPQ